MRDKDLFLIELLKRAGWHEGRKLDRNYIIKLIKEEGYDVFSNVVDFLQEFINLKIIFENKRNGLKEDDINFSFEAATHLEIPARIHGEYFERIGKRLCLIGSVYREHMVLMMSNDKCVYAGYDSYLCKVADSGLGAIEAIIYDYDFIVIS